MMWLALMPVLLLVGVAGVGVGVWASEGQPLRRVLGTVAVFGGVGAVLGSVSALGIAHATLMAVELFRGLV